jgi:quercetin dioxygenase-like cupin family protein
MTMRLTLALAAACTLLAAPAFFAGPVWAETQEQLLTQGPPKTSQLLPDPRNIPMIFGKDILWKGETGEISAPLFGDPNRPGIYGVLIKWDPGHNSKPHFHSTDRYIYVVSGTWWVSSSTHYDASKMYPIPAGTFVTDIKNTIHWDGAKAETGPCILMLVGEGEMHTTRYVPKDAAKDADGQDFVAPPAQK